MHLLFFEVIFYSVIICSERTDFTVLFRVSFSAADELCPPGHFVGDRLIDPAVKFNFQPQPAVNFRVALASIQSYQDNEIAELAQIVNKEIILQKNKS